MTLRVLRTRALRDIVVVLVLVFGVGSVAMLLAHVSPIDGFAALFDGAFGTPKEVARDAGRRRRACCSRRWASRSRSAPGLFNIGAEGQLIMGGFAAGWLGAQFPLPGYFAIPMLLLAGALAGGAVGRDPRIHARPLRRERSDRDADAQRDRPAADDVPGDGTAAARRRRRSETGPLAKAAQLPDRSLFGDPQLTWAFVIAIVLAFVLRWVLLRTVFGYELRAAGDAPEAAKRAGIDLSHARWSR